MTPAVTQLINTYFKGSKNKLVGACAAVVILECLAAWFFILRPDCDKLSEIRRLKDDSSAKAGLLMSIADLEKKIKLYGPRLSKSGEISWLIESLNQMARESGVTLTSMTPQGAKAFDFYEKISLNVEAECDYHKLGGLASRIESAERFIKISDLKVVAPAPGQKSMQVTFTVSVFHPSGDWGKLLA